jgi:hypothetical protein
MGSLLAITSFEPLLTIARMPARNRNGAGHECLGSSHVMCSKSQMVIETGGDAIDLAASRCHRSCVVIDAAMIAVSLPVMPAMPIRQCNWPIACPE